jgi:hypothetical protein
MRVRRLIERFNHYDMTRLRWDEAVVEWGESFWRQAGTRA